MKPVILSIGHVAPNSGPSVVKCGDLGRLRQQEREDLVGYLTIQSRNTLTAIGPKVSIYEAQIHLAHASPSPLSHKGLSYFRTFVIA